MSDNTDLVNDPPEDNEVIRGLRQDVKDLTKAVKTAGSDAVAKVKRGATASSLMPEGFKGLADIYEAEVDGELTEDSAVEWLKGRGFAAPSDEAEEKAAEAANALEVVTNLSGAVAAAGSLTPADSVITRLEAIDTTDRTQTLLEVSEKVERAIKGQ